MATAGAKSPAHVIRLSAALREDLSVWVTFFGQF